MNNAEVMAASQIQFNSKLLSVAPVNFWKVCRISSSELLTSAMTGDILLFTGKQMQDRIIRTMTGSRYDHVGMLIKYQKSGEVFLFESLTGVGVQRWSWQHYQQQNYWRQNYSKIVYRRLLGVERNQEF